MTMECLTNQSETNFFASSLYQVSIQMPDSGITVFSFHISAESWFDAKRLSEYMSERLQLGDKYEFVINHLDSLCMVII